MNLMPESDYIARSDLIMRIRYYLAHTPEDRGEHYAYSVALKEIQDAPAADVAPPAQWIPVAERLPEKWLDDAGMVNYMIYSPDFGVDIGCYHAEAKKWLCMALPCTVTHWMPMPELPKEENNGNQSAD